MPDRRTTVVLDIQIGDIYAPQGVVRIPAQVEIEEPKDSGPGKGIEALGKRMQATLQKYFGPEIATWVTGFFLSFLKGIEGSGAALSAALPYVLGFAAAIVTLYLAVKVAVWYFNLLKEMLGALRKALEWLWNAFLKVNRAMIDLIAIPLRPAIQGSIDAFSWLTREATRAGETIYDFAVNTLTEASKQGAVFEQQVANTVTVLGQFGEASAAARQEVSDLAIAMTRGTGTTAIEAVKGMWNVASAGYSAIADLEHVTKASIALANASLEPLAATTMLTTSVLHQFSLATDQADRVVNALAASAVASSTDIPKLMESLKYAGPVAAGFGLTIEDTAAILGVFANQGILASNAGTAIRAMFTALSRTGENKEGTKYFAEVGEDINKFNLIHYSLYEVLVRIDALRKRIGQGALAELFSKSFGIREFSALLALANQGPEALKKMQAAVTGTNLAYQMQADQLRTLQGSWKILINLWSSAQIVMSRGLNPVLVEAVHWLQRMVDYGTYLGVFERFGRLGGQAFEALIGPLTTLGEVAGDTVSALINLVSEAIAAIRPAIVGALPYLQQFIEWLPSMAGGVLRLLVDLGTWFLQVGMPLFIRWVETVGPRMVDIFDKVGFVIANLLADNGDTLIRWFSQLLDFADYLVSNLPMVAQWVGQVATATADWARYIIDLVQNAFPQLAKSVTDLVPLFIRFAADVLPILAYEVGIIVGKLDYLGTTVVPNLVAAFEGSAFEGVTKTLDQVSKLIDLVLQTISKLTEIMRQNPDLMAPLTTFFKYLVENGGQIIQTIIAVAKTQVLLSGFKWWLEMLVTGNWKGMKMVSETTAMILDALTQLSAGLSAAAGAPPVSPTSGQPEPGSKTLPPGMTPIEGRDYFKRQADLARSQGDEATAKDFDRKARDAFRSEPSSWQPTSARPVEGYSKAGNYTLVLQYSDLASLRAAANRAIDDRADQERHVQAVGAARIA